MVRIISISDEVYTELSQIKGNRSFTKVIKDLMAECNKKGDPKSILEFLKSHEPLSEEDTKRLTEASEEARRNATPRKSASFELYNGCIRHLAAN